MNYEKTITVLRTLRPFFFLSAAIFMISLILGFVTVGPNKPKAENATASVELGFFDILFNNAAVLLVMLFGCLTFGLTAAFLLFTTGSSLGGLIHVGLSEGLDPAAIVLLVVPHGIIELPGFFLASAISFNITFRLAGYLLEYRERPFSTDELAEYLFLAVISYVLIVTAAGVESTLTLQYVKNLP